MAAVKGSKEYKLKVVKDRPYLKGLVSFTCFLVLVVVSGLTYTLGHDRGMNAQEQALADVEKYKGELSVARAEVAELQQQMANIHLGSEVDKQANEGVRLEVIELKEQITALEKDNSFYRSIMEPRKDKGGVFFDAVSIASTESELRLKVVIKQLAVNHRLLSGQLGVVIIGKQIIPGVDGAEPTETSAKYNFSDLSSDVTEASVKLRFKYFQTVEGALDIPEGFKPERIELNAKISGKKPKTISKSFGWLVEKACDVG